jgi:uncharacterized protein YqjF (DUF2071 family)
VIEVTPNRHQGSNPARTFLTAEWRNLAMLNYELDPSLLRRLVPAGTELDHWNGQTFISLVGFQFLHTRVFGLSFPFHRNFEEVNLRFYVRREEGATVKRGVVFIREIVPRWAIAAVARSLYHENYLSLPMSHRINSGSDRDLDVSYKWKLGQRWNTIGVAVAGEPVLPGPGSEQQFIAEHYWGYAVQRDGGSMEYQVAHPPWRVWTAHDASFQGDAEALYGEHLGAILRNRPSSAFLAEGSEVTVYQGRRLQRMPKLTRARL